MTKRATIITCAVTGGDDVASRYPAVPVTPEQIANQSIDAANAGAAIIHIHVRDPETGKPSMALDLYKETVERIDASGVDVIINLTTGPGARFIPSDTELNTAAPGSNLRTPEERVRHIALLKPELCTLDMGTLNFGKGALINVPGHIEAIAKVIREVGVKPELEVFDTGHIAFANRMLEQGIVPANPLFQIVLGVPWGAPANSETMMHMRNLLPHGAMWAAFGIARHEFQMVAQAALLGGQVRVGLEDNLFLSKGVEAVSNAVLVERAVHVLDAVDCRPASPSEARAMLGLPQRGGAQAGN